MGDDLSGDGSDFNYFVDVNSNPDITSDVPLADAGGLITLSFPNTNPANAGASNPVITPTTSGGSSIYGNPSAVPTTTPTTSTDGFTKFLNSLSNAFKPSPVVSRVSGVPIQSSTFGMPSSSTSMIWLLAGLGLILFMRKR